MHESFPSSNPEDSPEEAARIAANQAEFNEKCADFYANVYRMMRRRGQQHASAEDIAQAALEKAYKNIARYRDTGQSMDAWITTIALNLMKDGHKAYYNQNVTLVSEWERDISGDDGPEAIVLTGVESDTLYEVLAYLRESSTDSDRDMGIIQGIMIEGMTMTEYAESADVSLGALKQQILRIRNRARKRYGSFGNVTNY